MSERAPAAAPAGGMIITAHFTLDEFRCRSGAPYPDVWIHDRLYSLCAALEAIRAELGGHPIWILSGYRTADYNARIGGARYSQHVEGRAADVTVEGIAPSDVHAAALRLHEAGRIAIGGLGLYGAWCHVDVRPGERLARWTGAKVGDEVA